LLLIRFLSLSSKAQLKIKMLKKFVLIISLLALCSCGFQVVYKENDKQADFDYEKELAAIRIKKNRTKLDQDLKNNLYDLLNPDYVKTEPKYFLTLTALKTTTSTFTTSTGASGRNRIFIDVKYDLKDLQTGKTISIGALVMNDNYDVTNNRFATYTSDEYVALNLTKSIAKNIRNSLLNDLIELKKKEEMGEEAYCKEKICLK